MSKKNKKKNKKNSSKNDEKNSSKAQEQSGGDWTDEHYSEAASAYEGYSDNDAPLTGSNSSGGGGRR